MLFNQTEGFVCVMYYICAYYVYVFAYTCILLRGQMDASTEMTTTKLFHGKKRSVPWHLDENFCKTKNI